jgi:cation diffusion facilitator family transporter
VGLDDSRQPPTSALNSEQKYAQNSQLGLKASAALASLNDAPLKRASEISLVVSILLLVIKFIGYRLTHSQAVFSDAMESIVNVVAAAVAIFVVWYARKPADQEHPYGHGKAEFFSAAFEGGMIAFASILIAVEAVRALIHGRPIEQVKLGIAITIGTGIGNALLGFYLLRMGRRAK